MSLFVPSGLYLPFSPSSPSFFRNGPGTAPALARPVLGPQARGGLSLVFPLLLALCCSLIVPSVAQAGEKQVKVKPRVKYYQVEDVRMSL